VEFNMYVIDQDRPVPTPIPGLRHVTWAGHDDGLEQLSLWRSTIDPGGATPPHSHPCDEVVLCSAGRGELHINGEVHRFGADQTLVIPRNAPHQIFNVGELPMEILGIFAATPVQTYLPDGEKLELPWRT
jgi:quercetin dioxygenase-like cupin family protein